MMANNSEMGGDTGGMWPRVSARGIHGNVSLGFQKRQFISVADTGDLSLSLCDRQRKMNTVARVGVHENNTWHGALVPPQDGKGTWGDADVIILHKHKKGWQRLESEVAAMPSVLPGVIAVVSDTQRTSNNKQISLTLSLLPTRYQQLRQPWGQRR